METLATHQAKRTVRKFTERTTDFLELGGRAARTLGGVLDELAPNTERVYLVGPRPGPGGIDGVRRWAGELGPGWHEHERGHYLEGEHPVVRVTHDDGRNVEVLRAAVYFGDGDYTGELAAAAWSLLRDELGRHFPRATLLSSPAATGRELFLQSIPRGTVWPTMPDELQSLVRRTSGQGRIELLAPRAPTVGELVEYDGRLMYAALCRELPGGPVEHRVCREYLGQQRARYFGRVRVPRDWDERCRCGAPGHAGIGLLAYAPPDKRDGWEYPSEPGRSWQGWHDGAELHVALAHGWDFAPASAIVFGGYRGAGPLDGWARRLLAARESLELRARGRDELARAAELASIGVRSIILHAIGGFHGAAHRVTRSVSIDEADKVPVDARDLRVESDRLVWAEHTGPGWPELAHPEWSSAIWARARARLLDGPAGDGHRSGALNADAATVLGFRTDAVYLTRDPHWNDDGRPGRLRVQRRRSGPFPWPTSHAALLAVRG